MMQMEQQPRSGLRGSHSRSRQKNTFQRELESKMQDRKSRGLSYDDSDDDGLGSDDELLVHFNSTAKNTSRPGSAKHRSSPSGGMSRTSPLAAEMMYQSLGTEGQRSGRYGGRSGDGGSPGYDDIDGDVRGRYDSNRGSPLADELLRQRPSPAATPPPRVPPRKGQPSPKPEKQLTKEDIIFGGRSGSKIRDTGDLPLRNEPEKAKKWEPPSFTRNSPSLLDGIPKVSPRSSIKSRDDAQFGSIGSDLSRSSKERGLSSPQTAVERDSPYEGRERYDGRDKYGGRKSPLDSIDRHSGGRASPLLIDSTPGRSSPSSDVRDRGRTSPFDQRENGGRTSPLNAHERGSSDMKGSSAEEKRMRKKSLVKQKTIPESPTPASRFMKKKDEPKDDKGKSRASPTGSEVFKKGRSTPSYLVEESDSEDSTDEFIRRVKGHDVTSGYSGRLTPDGRGSPSKDDRSTTKDGRTTPKGRKSPSDGRKTPTKGDKDEKESKPVRKKSLIDHLIGDETPDKKKRSDKKRSESPTSSLTRNTPSPSPRNTQSSPSSDRRKSDRKPTSDRKISNASSNNDRRRSDIEPRMDRRQSEASPSADRRKSNASPLAQELLSSPNPDKPKPKARLRQRSSDEEEVDNRDVTRRESRDRRPPVTADDEDATSMCDDVERDPALEKAQKAQKESATKTKTGVLKQTRDRQQADDIIEKVAGLNEKETRSMQFIDPADKAKKNKVKVSKKDEDIVRPKPRYAMPKVKEDRPESVRSYTSTSEIRDSIYQDWYKEKMHRSKEELKIKEQKEKEEKEKAAKEKADKTSENRAAFEAWSKSKESWVKDKRSDKKTKEVEEVNKRKENVEKRKEGEMAYTTWKDNKGARLSESARKKKREEEKKKHAEIEKKLNREKESVELFSTWKSTKDEKLNEAHKEKVNDAREKKKQEQQEAEKKEEVAQTSYERWLENSEHREKRRCSLRISQSMDDLKSRPAWSPAKTVISTKNCRIK